MSILIWILCAAAAGAAWYQAGTARRAVRELEARLREAGPRPADEAAARRAREAIERFNDGIASILGFDAGAGGGEGL
ncbi:MAG: hypothetical protein HFF17_06935 [Oscillospiraceae bacterium]|nr:hypothetical protein [Oscillospiraceae bacterium]